MTKAEIASEISRASGIDKVIALTVIEKLMVVVKDSLINGENVYLRGFGTFLVKTRAEKTARNITKNTALVVPAHPIPAFKPSASFKREVAEANVEKK
ncbi:MAG: HU family DNA-binding protein [Duncaniella sp.]|nr:HU family DNA-binding protein [Duncaniella sp.]